MSTLAETIERFGVDVLDHLDRDSVVPVSDGLTRQGDVIVVPKNNLDEAETKVPSQGVAVVRSESGGNTHLLIGEGDVRFDAYNPGGTEVVLGKLTVGSNATAFMAHPEHAYSGLSAGTYEIRRQKEQADEIRLVQD